MILAVLAFCLLAAPNGAVKAAGKVKLSAKKVTLYPTQTKKLKLKGASKSVTWSSTNPDVAGVSSQGKVTAVGAGSCRIKAAYGKKTYSCKVTVNRLKLAKTSLQMVRGRQEQLSFNYKKLEGVRWSSSEPQVAGVGKTGIIRSHTAGKTVITAQCNGVKYHCSVTVTEISADNLVKAYPATKANRKKIILAGSSSMDFWSSAPQAFAPYGVINTAIGGTTVTQWLKWYKKLITNYKPGAVVLYVGSNDIADGRAVTGKKNAANTIDLLKKIMKERKKIPVFYLSVNPCWAREGGWKEIRESNALVKKYCAKTKYLYYIDIASAFAREDGTPDPELFGDQLHPNEAGYGIWKNVVAKYVKRIVRRLKK